MRAHDLGRRSEDLACEWLRRRGWQILARNFRAGHKEVDIIARGKDIIAFIEVKARAGPAYGHPFEAITWKKRLEIAHVARVWLHTRPHAAAAYRFDAIAICWNGNTHTVEHIEDAWRIELRR